MRTFKFRAWHTVERKMDEVTSIHFWRHLVYVATEPLSWTFHEIELMQFTGLVDRTGKEVYEGDIYRNLDNGLIGKFYYLNGPGGYTLHCKENNADGSPYNMLPFAQLDTTNFEVIGNIYEHPELVQS